MVFSVLNSLKIMQEHHERATYFCFFLLQLKTILNGKNRNTYTRVNTVPIQNLINRKDITTFHSVDVLKSFP